MSTSNIIKTYLQAEDYLTLDPSQEEWLTQSLQLDHLDEDGFRSKTVFMELESGGKVTAESIKLFNFLQFNQFKFLKYFIDNTQGAATLIAGLTIQQPVVAIFGVLKLVWDFVGTSTKKFSELDAEVLYTMYMLGLNGQVKDISGKYQELFEKPIKPAHLENALSLLVSYKTIEQPNRDTYRLVETIMINRG